MSQKLKTNDIFPKKTLADIHDKTVNIPDSSVTWTHLQFRRFAGCPICNLHLQSFVKRNEELKSNGIREVVVFHSSKDALLPYQGNFPFHVIGDPEKKLYKQFGVETSIWAILSPKVWGTIFKANAVKDKPKGG